MTINALYPTNLAMMEWLKNDSYFKASRRKTGPYRDLAQNLAELDVHLLLWRAKYEAWIPNSPQHALVYMADENAHGVRFPTDLDHIIAKVLQ
jgi:hypothetical protein